MLKMLMPMALAALLAEPGSAFMPAVAPVLRARSPMLSSRARPDALPRLAGQRGGALFLIASSGFTVGVLGDLHLDPRKMEDYETGKVQWMPHLKEAQEKHGNVAMVSLGDLGESKSVRPAETNELFAGTTECHQLAAKFLVEGRPGVPDRQLWVPVGPGYVCGSPHFWSQPWVPDTSVTFLDPGIH